MHRRTPMFLLGAGASKSFGMKLAQDLFDDFFRKAPNILAQIYPPYWKISELPWALKTSQYCLKKTPNLDYLLCAFSTDIPFPENLQDNPPWKNLRKKLEQRFGYSHIRRLEIMLRNSIEAYLISELFRVRSQKNLQKTYNALFKCFGNNLDIFTTNYDLCVETYCKKNGMECHRGFVPTGKSARAVRVVSFTPKDLDMPGVRLHKFYGSVDLGFTFYKKKELVEITDPSRYMWRDFFMLAGPTIYDIYWRSFYLESGSFEIKYAKELLSRFGGKLWKTNKLVIVGYSFSAFGDPIAAAIKAVVKQKRRLKAYAIDPNPNKRRIQRLLNHPCKFIQLPFCEESIKRLHALIENDC